MDLEDSCSSAALNVGHLCDHLVVGFDSTVNPLTFRPRGGVWRSAQQRGTAWKPKHLISLPKGSAHMDVVDFRRRCNSCGLHGSSGNVAKVDLAPLSRDGTDVLNTAEIFFFQGRPCTFKQGWYRCSQHCGGKILPRRTVELDHAPRRPQLLLTEPP